MNDGCGRQDRRDGLYTGLVLMGLGVLFLLQRLTGLHVAGLWPLVLVLLGLAYFFPPVNGKRAGDGVMFVLLGLAFLAIQHNYQGLEYRTGWPLFLLAIGAGMVVRSIWPRSPSGPDGRHSPE